MRPASTLAMPTLADLNAMDRDTFVAILGPTFENAPWVADGAWSERPFDSVEALHRSMMDVVRQSPPDAIVAFLRGHPDLAGKEARAGTMTKESVDEQATAGMGALSRDEFEEVQVINASYRERHGFPFIISARRHTKDQILREMRRRVAGDTAGETDEAMKQIGLITRYRLDALLDS